MHKTNSFIVSIAVTGSHAKVKNPALSFVNSLSEPFEYGEFEQVTLERISGSDLHAPYDITDTVKSGRIGDVPLYSDTDHNGDRWIRGGTMGRYLITFHNVSYTQLGKTDTMDVYLDDLNGYHNGDIFKSTKAEPVHLARIYSSTGLVQD